MAIERYLGSVASLCKRTLFKHVAPAEKMNLIAVNGLCSKG